MSVEEAQQLEEVPTVDPFLKLGNMAARDHIRKKKRPERILDVPEWDLQIRCKSMSAEGRIVAQMAAYNKDAAMRIDYRRAVFEVIRYGAYNMMTDTLLFEDEDRDLVLHDSDGQPAERLFMAIMQLSKIYAESDAETARKN